MKTKRDNLYAGYVALMESRDLTARPRTAFDGSFDKGKAWTLARMGERQCPMTFAGVSKIAGWSGTAPGRLIVVLHELVEEGELIVTHRPDGNDTWHHPSLEME